MRLIDTNLSYLLTNRLTPWALRHMSTIVHLILPVTFESEIVVKQSKDCKSTREGNVE